MSARSRVIALGAACVGVERRPRNGVVFILKRLSLRNLWWRESTAISKEVAAYESKIGVASCPAEILLSRMGLNIGEYAPIAVMRK